MPATPYFITAQIALVTVSALVVKLDSMKPKQPARSVPMPMSMESPVDPELLGRATFLPKTPIERFGPSETDETELPISETSRSGRPMGFSDLEVASSLPGAFEASSPPQSIPTVQDAPSAPPEFEPVPTSMGYHISSDAATNFDMKSNTVVFSGKVTLKTTDLILEADRLIVHMNPGETQTLKKLVANGKVDFHLIGVPKEEVYRGSGEQAVFDPNTGIIVMSGWPKIIGQGREHIAAASTTVMSLNTKSPRLETEGRAQTRLLMDGSTGMPNLTMGTPSAPSAPGQN